MAILACGFRGNSRVIKVNWSHITNALKFGVKSLINVKYPFTICGYLTGTIQLVTVGQILTPDIFKTSSEVIDYAKKITQGNDSDIEKAIKLYYAVRDEMYYDLIK